MLAGGLVAAGAALLGARGLRPGPTGVVTTPDGRTMFVSIQNPGETSSERSDANNPTAVSAWPDGFGRPRSATVMIRRRDGGVIGA